LRVAAPGTRASAGVAIGIAANPQAEACFDPIVMHFSPAVPRPSRKHRWDRYHPIGSGRKRPEIKEFRGQELSGARNLPDLPRPVGRCGQSGPGFREPELPISRHRPGRARFAVRTRSIAPVVQAVFPFRGRKRPQSAAWLRPVARPVAALYRPAPEKPGDFLRAMMRPVIKESGRAKSSESVRSVERAIDVLQALNRNPLSTLGELHRQTSIPKSSLVRLLRALETEGLVAQTASYSAYRLLSPVTSLSSGSPQEPRVVGIANPIMIDFTKAEGWPMALALFEDNAMVVRASTIPYTSLAIIQSSLEIRLSMVGHAHGQAYLAHLPADRQKPILETIRHSTRLADAAARNLRQLKQLLRQVRERGYALRHQHFHTQSSSIAVPVYEDGRIAATLGMTWLSPAMPVQQALDLYVPRLVAMSDAVSRTLDGRLPNA
jgi:IclR family mhp operon transcriptional activator